MLKIDFFYKNFDPKAFARSLKKLKIHNIPNPDLDLRILLNYSSKSKKKIFLSNFNDTDIDLHKFHSILNRRLNFEPISKIINKKNSTIKIAKLKIIYQRIFLLRGYQMREVLFLGDYIDLSY